jgi:hypothetical protein
MPAGSLGARLTNMFMKEKYSSGYQYHLVPELMWGVNKKLVLHAMVLSVIKQKIFQLKAEASMPNTDF